MGSRGLPSRRRRAASGGGGGLAGKLSGDAKQGLSATNRNGKLPK
jgi:hypothetical protein